MNQTDPTLSRSIIEFAAIATEYCNLVENANRHDKLTYIRSMRSLIPLLYLRGSLLSATEPDYPEANERYVTQEQWDGIFANLRDLLAQDDLFQYVATNEYSEKTTLKGSLSEHFADVYQDMKDFTLLFKKTSFDARENAIYQVFKNYSTHWGLRLATIIPVLHELCLSPNDHNDLHESPDFF